MSEIGTGVLIGQLLENYVASSRVIISALVYDRQGLLIEKASQSRGGENQSIPTDQDEVFGAIGSLVEPILKKVVDYEIGSFGSGTFESEDYTLIFIEAGTKAILLTVVPFNAEINQVMPYCYLVAEKIAALLSGSFNEYQTLVMPQIDIGLGGGKFSDHAERDGDFLRLHKHMETAFKLIILGDHAVGKTSLVNQFVTRKFDTDYRPTLGLSITEQEFFIQGFEDSKLKFLIYDLAGQRFFQRVRKHYYHGAHTAFIMYDLTRRETFDNITTWLDDLRQYMDIPVVIIGNKLDLLDDRAIPEGEARARAKELRCSYMETSAKTGQNVKDAFNLVGIGLFFQTRE